MLLWLKANLVNIVLILALALIVCSMMYVVSPRLTVVTPTDLSSIRPPFPHGQGAVTSPDNDSLKTAAPSCA